MFKALFNARLNARGMNRPCFCLIGIPFLANPANENTVGIVKKIPSPMAETSMPQ
jgi:hypothetical protein